MGYLTARDQRVADTTTTDNDLKCAAVGCPNRWSVNGDRGKACSAHYWADRMEWPRITQEQQDAVMNRRPPDPPVNLTREEKAAIIARLQDVVRRLTRGQA